MSSHDMQLPEVSNPFEPAAAPPARKPAARPPVAAAPATPEAGGARDLDYAAAWADEVDGVPTHNVAHPDDGDAIITTEKKGTKYSSDKKKRQKLTDANHTVERSKTTTTRDGDVTDTEERKLGVTVNKSGGSLTHSKSDEHKIGDGDDAIATKTSASRGVEVSKTGAGVKLGHEVEVSSAGGKTQGHGREISAGYDDGHVKAEYKTSKKHGTEHAGHEEESSFGLSGGQLTVGTGSKTETKRKETIDGEEVEKKSSRGHSTSFGIGTDSMSASHTRSQTGEDGTKRAVSMGGSVDTHGNASANAGWTRTNKDGESVSVSVKAGVSVECSEPQPVNGKWQVVYKRGKNLGASGGGASHGVGVNAGVSTESYDTGTRSFKTKQEAEDFRTHAAERIPPVAPDPQTLLGALCMEVGETLGHGEAEAGQLGASASFEGATLSLTGTKKSSDEVAVHRVSTNIFEITTSRGALGGKDLGLSGLGIGLNRGDSDSSGSSMTLRFDLANPLGAWAFQFYCSTKMIPPFGCKVVSTTESKGEESHEGVNVFGQLNDVHQRRSWESETHDDEGKHEEYGGEKSHTISAGKIAHWLGDKNITEVTRLVGKQDNDATADYSFEAIYGGESGKTNRKNLGFLSADLDDQGATSDKSSGEWKMSADIPYAAVKKMLKSIPRLANIKGNDAQMRALGEYVKQHGAGAARAIEGLGETHLAWDLELNGDPSFPGKKGRVEAEAKVRQLAELMQKSLENPQAAVSQVQHEMDSLEARRKEVADPKKYPDLPDALRAQQLELIDAQIQQFSAVRHQGAVELTKQHAGEDPEAVAKRHDGEHGYDGLVGPQRDLARLRDEIAILDGKLAAKERQNREARAALAYAAGHYTDAKRAKQAGAEKRAAQKDKLELGGMMDDRHRVETLGGVDDLRMELVCNLAQPERALFYGNALRTRLEQQLALVDDAGARLRESAQIQATMNSDKSLAGKHGAFWAEVEDAMDDDAFVVKPKEDPYAKPYTSMALP